MADVVTTAGSVSCAHGGKAVLSSEAKLTVAGQPALVAAQTWKIPPGQCTQTGTTPPQTPCTTVSLLSGAAQKLTAGGKAVVLASSVLQTNGLPVNTATVVAGQARVRAT
jgi:hypothetical protein